MIRYEVTLEVDAQLRAAVEHYMRGHHIADVLSSGCFLDARFDREGDLFRTTYHAATRADLDRYLAQHANRLRDDFARHFPGGVTATRKVWEALQEWPPSA